MDSEYERANMGFHAFGVYTMVHPLYYLHPPIIDPIHKG